MNPKTKEHTRITWSTVQPQVITWLWPGRIPFGKITIFCGDAGSGKTTMAVDIAARLTTGRPMPLSDAEPITGNVIFQSQEDDLADTLLPRCMSAGADTNRISSIEAANLNIDEDCGIIEQHIQETGARLVVFDPLQSYMGRNADMCRITDVRRLLSNLGGVAARTNCAVLIIAHQNKAQGTKELYRVFGSVDITATARSVLRLSVSENDPEIRILSHIKSSVSRPCAPIYFRIADDGSILYLDEYDGDFDVEEIPDDSSKRAKATEIIFTMLNGAPQEGIAVYKACKEAGISSRTVERVKKELNIGSGRDEANRRMWVLQ